MLTLEYGFTGYIVAADDPATISRFGQEVAPALHELVAAGRQPRPERGTRPDVKGAVMDNGHPPGAKRHAPASRLNPFAAGMPSPVLLPGRAVRVWSYAR